MRVSRILCKLINNLINSILRYSIYTKIFTLSFKVNSNWLLFFIFPLLQNFPRSYPFQEISSIPLKLSQIP